MHYPPLCIHNKIAPSLLKLTITLFIILITSTKYFVISLSPYKKIIFNCSEYSSLAVDYLDRAIRVTRGATSKIRNLAQSGE